MIKSQAIKGEYCEKQASVTPQKSIGIIGSRTLPYTLAIQVGLITEDLIKRKYHIATGGAIGTDQFVIERLLRLGLSDHCTVYLEKIIITLITFQ